MAPFLYLNIKKNCFFICRINIYLLNKFVKKCIKYAPYTPEVGVESAFCARGFFEMSDGQFCRLSGGCRKADCTTQQSSGCHTPLVQKVPPLAGLQLVKYFGFLTEFANANDIYASKLEGS